jgi:predicted negative regulator of RcsB-dependent stress response
MRAFFTIFFLGLGISPVMSAEPVVCAGTDRLCLMQELSRTADQIEDAKWRNIAYRELAKSLAADGKLAEAMALIPKITNGDTQALTIRGIGMAAAGLSLPSQSYDDLFESLAALADKITDIPSRDIAYTYIAMSQSFAKQDGAAIKTAKAMTNPALKHKALAEIAEVQAERKDAIAALTTLKEIDADAYRNKATRTITLLLSDRGLFNEAAQAAHSISNPTLKAEALQYIIAKQAAP